MPGKFCEHCGYRLDKDSATCPHCGKLNEGTTVVKQERKKQQEKMKEEAVTKKPSEEKEGIKKPEERMKPGDTSSAWKKRIKHEK